MGNLRCVCTRRSSTCVNGKKMYSFIFDCGLQGPDSPHDVGLSRFREADGQSISHALAAAMKNKLHSSNDLAWLSSLLAAIVEQY